jgi:hypothetical protein
MVMSSRAAIQWSIRIGRGDFTKQASGCLIAFPYGCFTATGAARNGGPGKA